MTASQARATVSAAGQWRLDRSVWYFSSADINLLLIALSSSGSPHYMPCMTLVNWGEPERAPHRRDSHARIVYWGELHIDGIVMRELFIYIYVCMYGTTVTRGAAHTQYTLCAFQNIPRNRPHAVMFASSTAQACNIHCHVFKHRSSYVCALVLIVVVKFRNEDI